MASATVPYSFTGGTNAVAAEVNSNFSTVLSFLNGSVVHRDGSKSMTGQLTLGAGDPTSDGHAARKAYVDKYDLGGVETANLTTTLVSTGETGSNLSPTVTIADPGYDIIVWGYIGIVATSTSLSGFHYWNLGAKVDDTLRSRVRVPFIGGGTYHSVGTPIKATTHTTGTACTVKAFVNRYSGGGNLNLAVDGSFAFIDAFWTAAP